MPAFAQLCCSRSTVFSDFAMFCAPQHFLVDILRAKIIGDLPLKRIAFTVEKKHRPDRRKAIRPMMQRLLTRASGGLATRLALGSRRTLRNRLAPGGARTL